MLPFAAAGRRLVRGIRRAPGPLRRRAHRFAVRRATPSRKNRPALAEPWSGAAQWFPGGTPPSEHNRVTPLIDGDSFFADLQEALSAAQHYVYIIGWCMTPAIPLRHTPIEALTTSRVYCLLSETARRIPIRILLWSGAPVLFQPDTRSVEAVRRFLEGRARDVGADLQCRLDHSARFSHCHHQKAIVVDGRVAFVGGMDLTTFQGDRWDQPGHPLRAGPNWHDVQIRLEGEAVADVECNFHQRWQAVTGESDLPRREPTWEAEWRTPVQIVRTIPRRVYNFAPRGEFGIHHAYLQAIGQARRLIYLENQYLWSSEIREALIAAMRRNTGTTFRIVIVLPARAFDGKDDNDQHVDELRKADKGRGMVSVYCPYASGPNAGERPFTYRPTYVHAKVGVIDDEWLLIGSANLNDRGLITDSEIMALMHDATLARQVRVDLWTEHLGLPREQVEAAEAHTLADDVWVGHARRNTEIIKKGELPLIGSVHRYEPGRMPGSWFLDEAQALVVEH